MRAAKAVESGWGQRMRAQSYQVELTRSDYAVGLSTLVGEIARQDKARARLLFARLAVAVVMVNVVGFAFPDAMAGLFLALVLIFVADLVVQGVFQTQTIGVSFDPAAHASNRLEFSEAGLVERNALRTRTWTWDSIRRVHLPPGYVVIEVAGWDMIILPDRLWPSAAERGAFLAELEARRIVGAVPGTGFSPREAEASAMLIEPVLIARIFLAVEAWHFAFQTQVSRPAEGDEGATLIALAVALLAGTIAWLASGFAFRWLARRSPAKAIAVAWGVVLLLAVQFALWYVGIFPGSPGIVPKP
jgi:hypothetical protein